MRSDSDEFESSGTDGTTRKLKLSATSSTSMPLPLLRTRRFSVTTGVTVGLIGTLLGFSVLLLPTYVESAILRLLIFFGSFALLTYFSHCLAHFVVGQLIGLKFSHYVLGSSPLGQTNSKVIKRLDTLLPRLGIRLTPQTRENATHTQRVFLFSSGVITSTLLPLIPVTVGYSILPNPLEAILPLLWLAYVAFGVYFSPRFGDLSRIKKPG